MNYFRGIVLVAAGCLALFASWKIHTGNRALWACGLGLVAIGIGVWRITRKPDRPRLRTGSSRPPNQGPGRRNS